MTDIAPLAILGWGLLLSFYLPWRIRHERRMAALRKQLSQIEGETP